MASRVVIVDDTSSRILYDGPGWDSVTSTSTQSKNLGEPYNDTLHTSQLSGTFSFAFSGTSVEVNGFNNSPESASVLDPTWECSVDDILIDGRDKMQFSNPLTICQQPDLEDGPHTLIVDVTGALDDNGDLGIEFRFDHILYTPSPSANLENRAIMFQHDDPDLRYGPGWLDATPYVATMTNQTGSFFELNFAGTVVSAFSILPEEFFESDLMLGSYSIDDGPSTPFNQTGHINEVVTQFNKKMFTTPAFSSGRHKLTVTYAGSYNTNPMYLDYLIVENDTSSWTSSALPTSSTSPAISVSPIISAISATPLTSASSDSVPSTHNSHGKRIGAILGGVLGGVALLILLIWRCWPKDQKGRIPQQAARRLI